MAWASLNHIDSKQIIYCPHLLNPDMFTGVPSCSTEVTVTLKVTDHSTPVFEKQFYRLTVPENIEVNTPLPVTITASVYGSTLIYNITGGDLYNQFSVNFTTGNSIVCVYLTIVDNDYNLQISSI